MILLILIFQHEPELTLQLLGGDEAEGHHEGHFLEGNEEEAEKGLPEEQRA